MGLMKLLLIAAAILVALYFFSPTTYATVKNTGTELWNSVWGKIHTTPTTPHVPSANETACGACVTVTPNATCGTCTSIAYGAQLANPAPVPSGPPDGSQPATNTTAPTGLTTPSPLANVSACTRIHHGFPNYAGTSKEGDTCISVPTNRDEECLANPPTNYDGALNPTLHYSNPDLACCEGDGQCRWN